MQLYIIIIWNTIRKYTIIKIIKYTNQARKSLDNIWRNFKNQSNNN